MFDIKSILTGAVLSDSFWCLDMLCLSFIKERRKYQLHIQCLCRLTDNGTITASSGDIYYSSSDSRSNTISEIINENIAENKNTKIRDVFVQKYGDVSISFSDGTVMEIIVDAASHDTEQWRFIKVDSGEEHLVCYPNRICSE